MLCRKMNSVENSIAELRREIRRNKSSTTDDEAGLGADDATDGDDPTSSHRESVTGVQLKSDMTGDYIHIGGGSVPAMAIALGQGNRELPEVQDLLRKAILPIFGLDNESATYPFVDLWGLPHGSLPRAQELSKALPGDAQMLSLFRYYRDMGNVIYPGIADTQLLESDLTVFLISRAAQVNTEDGVTEQSIFGKSLQWIGMLFAALASGSQCSGLPRKERELTSQVYGKHSGTFLNDVPLTVYKSAAASNVYASPTSLDVRTLRTYKHFLCLAMSSQTT